jgi:hypothetical protein
VLEWLSSRIRESTGLIRATSGKLRLKGPVGEVAQSNLYVQSVHQYTETFKTAPAFDLTAFSAMQTFFKTL